MRYIFFSICILFLIPVYGQSKSTLKRQLIGRWISEDDKLYEVVFNDSTKRDFYGGKLESTYCYWIRKDSLVAKDVSDGSVFNYDITGLTENHLTLMYLKRGNLLMFRKQKQSTSVKRSSIKAKKGNKS